MPSIPPTAAGGNKREGSNTIMSTLFALEFWSNKIMDVDGIDDMVQNKILMYNNKYINSDVQLTCHV